MKLSTSVKLLPAQVMIRKPPLVMRQRCTVVRSLAAALVSASHAPPKLESSMRQADPPVKLNSPTLPAVVTGAWKLHPVKTQSVVPALITKLLDVVPKVPLKPRKVTEAQPFSVNTGGPPAIV